MKKYVLIIAGALIFGCNSKNDTSKVEILKEVSKNSFSENAEIIIYDTLVFNQNMNGELLNEKFNSAKDELEFYQKFINPKAIDSLITITEKHTETEIKYLGLLTDLNKIDSYHVLTNFKVLGIDQMLSPKGKSELTFINQKNNQIMIYDLTMPSDLPKCIEKNILYFDIENTKIGISISGGLPPELCIPKLGCN